MRLTADTVEENTAGRAREPGAVVDGELSEDAWQHATKITRWYEVNPGDNTEPAVKSVGFLTDDDRFFYAAFEFDDPNPRAIRAPLGDHDNIGNGFDDDGGVLLDTRNSGRTGTFFVVTPHNTLNWQSVMFVGYGDDRTLTDEHRLEKADRQFFLKILRIPAVSPPLDQEVTHHV